MSTLKVHSDDDQFWLVERHGTTDRHHLQRERSLDEHVDDNSTRSLGWSSAGAGADDFDRGEESKVRTMLNAIEVCSVTRVCRSKLEITRKHSTRRWST